MIDAPYFVRTGSYKFNGTCNTVQQTHNNEKQIDLSVS